MKSLLKYMARGNGWLRWHESPSMLGLDFSKLWSCGHLKVPLPALGSASFWWAALWASSKREISSVKMGFHFLTKRHGKSSAAVLTKENELHCRYLFLELAKCLSAEICNDTVSGSTGTVSLNSFSIALYLKVCSSPLSHHCCVRGGAVVDFTMDKGCPEHVLAKMRHTGIFTSEKYCSVELNTLHIASPP